MCLHKSTEKPKLSRPIGKYQTNLAIISRILEHAIDQQHLHLFKSPYCNDKVIRCDITPPLHHQRQQLQQGNLFPLNGQACEHMLAVFLI